MLKVAESENISRKSFIEKVQKRYADYLNTEKLGEYELLQEILGIKPSEEIVQACYTNYVDNGNLFLIKRLQGLTGIRPSLTEDVVQRGYITFIRKYWKMGFWGCTDNLSYQLPPIINGVKLLEEAVQEMYTLCIEQGEVRTVTQLMQIEFQEIINGIKPVFSEGFIQKCYADCIKKGKYEYSGLQDLQKLTGIKPSEEIVQSAYVDYIKKGELDNLRELQKLTGIEPSRKVYKIFIDSL